MPTVVIDRTERMQVVAPTVGELTGGHPALTHMPGCRSPPPCHHLSGDLLHQRHVRVMELQLHRLQEGVRWGSLHLTTDGGYP